MRSRPDWVCEVLSPSADPDRRTLTVLRWESAGYLAVLDAEAGEILRTEPFESLELRTGPIFGAD